MLLWTSRGIGIVTSASNYTTLNFISTKGCMVTIKVKKLAGISYYITVIYMQFVFMKPLIKTDYSYTWRGDDEMNESYTHSIL